MSGVFVEDPWSRIVNVHWKKKEPPDPPEPIPPETLCGFYERHNGTITWMRHDFTTGQNVITSLDREAAAAYAEAFYETYDPPGYPHDERNHTWSGFILGPGGISWETPAQPLNAFNVRVFPVVRHVITIHQNVTAYFVSSQGPGTYGYYLTYTNFLDVSTWVWLPNAPYPIYIGFPQYPHGLGYSNLFFIGNNPNRMPPRPPTWFTAYGSHGVTSLTSNLRYEYKSIPLPFKPGVPSSPFDQSLGGDGAFWFMNGPDEGPLSVQDPLYPDNLPIGYMWQNNLPNTSGESDDYLRIDCYCMDPALVFPRGLTFNG